MRPNLKTRPARSGRPAGYSAKQWRALSINERIRIFTAEIFATPVDPATLQRGA